jgi:hypothetical protein
MIRSPEKRILNPTNPQLNEEIENLLANSTGKDGVAPANLNSLD